MDYDELDRHKGAWQLIKKHLNDLKDGEDITFDQLWINLKMTEQNYLLAIRSSLKTPTIFLTRKPNELRINNYNAAWHANMDIQFVHISKFKLGTVEKNSSTTGPPAGIKPTPLRCRCNALATELRR